MSSHIIYEDIMLLFPVVNIDEVRSLAFYEDCLKETYLYMFLVIIYKWNFYST